MRILLLILHCGKTIANLIRIPARLRGFSTAVAQGLPQVADTWEYQGRQRLWLQRLMIPDMLICVAADSVVDLAQIFQAYQAAFNNPAFYTTTTEPAIASTYLKEVMPGRFLLCPLARCLPEDAWGLPSSQQFSP